MVHFIFYILIFLSMFLCIDLCRIELRRKSPFVFIWLSLFYIIFFPSLFDPFITSIQPHPNAPLVYLSSNNRLKYGFFIFIVIFSFRIMYIVYDYKLSNFKCRSVSSCLIHKSKASTFFYFILLFVSIFSFYEVFKNYGISFLNEFGFAERRSEVSDLSKFLLSYNYMAASGLGLWFFLKKEYYIFFLILVFYLSNFLLLGGSRQPLIAFFLPLVLWFVYQSKKPTFYLFLTLVLSSVFSFIFDLLIFLRNISSFSGRIAAISEPFQLFIDVLSREGGENRLRYAIYYFLDSSSSFEGFFQFKYFFREILFWLPSRLDFLSIKPEDFEYTMFYYFMGGREGSLHPTIFGSLYADSGWFFFPWVFLLSLIFYFVPVYIYRFSGIVYVCIWSTIGFYSLMFARGSLYAPVVVIFYSVLIAHLFTFLNKINWFKPR